MAVFGVSLSATARTAGEEHLRSQSYMCSIPIPPVWEWDCILLVTTYCHSYWEVIIKIMTFKYGVLPFAVFVVNTPLHALSLMTTFHYQYCLQVFQQILPILLMLMTDGSVCTSSSFPSPLTISSQHALDFSWWGLQEYEGLINYMVLSCSSICLYVLLCGCIELVLHRVNCSVLRK